jgi:hypothetical protein
MKKSNAAAVATVIPALATATGIMFAEPAAAAWEGSGPVITVAVHGHGTWVDDIFASRRYQPLDIGTIRGFFEITGPKTKVTGPTRDYRQSEGFGWFPHANVPTGTYCGAFWRDNGGGHFTKIDEVCGPVF